MTRTITLTRGYVTVVDDEDYEWLTQWNWCYGNGYAMRGVRRGGKQTTLLIHRAIMGEPVGMEVDHVSSDALDNRRTNLRTTDHLGNMRNRSKGTGKRSLTSVYKGVCKRSKPRTKGKPWEAKIGMHGVRTHLGSFATEIEAACAYDDAARELYGEYAKLNFASN